VIKCRVCRNRFKRSVRLEGTTRPAEAGHYETGSSLQDLKWAGAHFLFLRWFRPAEAGRCVLEGADLTQLIDRIRDVAERVARSYNLEIFDVQFRRESAGWVLRIFLDVPSDGETVPLEPGPTGGSRAWDGDASVSILDCERVSREVSAILDVEETIDHKYILEVSSPGLDRPLKSAKDYRRFAGRLAKIVVSEPVDGQKHFEGRLQGLDGDGVVIETKPGKRQLIPLSLVTRARLEVEF
jgi:ribosome maturation factor RimP